jgi:thymidylate synthase (FAD)
MIANTSPVGSSNEKMEKVIVQSVEEALTVLDKGSVRLIQQMGGDLLVLASARVSNGAELEEATKGEAADKKLINYLMKHRHGTPFEHSLFTFHVKAPIFVTREWMRHRIGSYNEISGRYTEFEPEFYYPERWRIPSDINKQSSIPIPERKEFAFWTIDGQYDDAIQEAWDSYQYLLEMGIAKEMARMVLPVSLYTQFYWTVNARSLMNFLSLRASNDAQWEIHQYASVIEGIFAAHMPWTYLAWSDNGRLAP